MVVRNLVEAKRAPILLAACLEHARELAVAEIERVQIDATRIMAPHHADVGYVEMIVPQPMQQVVGVVHPIRHHHAIERVVIRRLDAIRDAALFDVDRRLFDLACCRGSAASARENDNTFGSVSVFNHATGNATRQTTKINCSRRAMREDWRQPTSRRNRSCSAPNASIIAATVRAPD